MSDHLLSRCETKAVLSANQDINEARQVLKEIIDEIFMTRQMSEHRNKQFKFEERGNATYLVVNDG